MGLVATDLLATVRYDAFRFRLDQVIADLEWLEPVTLIDELLDSAFTCPDVARIVGVEVSAVERWQIGYRPGGGHHRALARLAAFTRIVSYDYQIPDLTAWMSVPIVAEVSTAPLDLYTAGRLDLLIDLAAGRLTREAVLDETDPGWQEWGRTAWMVHPVQDGQRWGEQVPAA